MQIEIIEGHDGSSYFWIKPVKVSDVKLVRWEDVEECEEEVSIEEGDVECFLSYFFYKYYDKELLYNRNREINGQRSGKDNAFEWYLEHNFYTYSAMDKMLTDIEKTAYLFAHDFDNAYLDEIKKNFSIFYMTEEGSDDYFSGVTDGITIKRNIEVVIDFYNRFVKRIRKMMDTHPEYNVLSIMGP